jgi:hypothetical protein
MKKLRPDFKNHSKVNKSWYDLREDWALIEASIAKQYGIRIRHHTDMPWAEFCTLIGGLMPDTPLGSVVQIRAEKDPKMIKAFTPDQKRIHSAWKRRQAEERLKDEDQLNKDIDDLAQMFASMFGKG